MMNQSNQVVTVHGHSLLNGRFMARTELLLATLAALIVVSGGTATAQSGGDYTVRKFAIASGGGTVAGGGYAATGTVGQKEAATIFGGDYMINGGFWSPAAAMSAASAPLPAAAPHDRPKNRYISFTPNNGANVVAFRVTKSTAPTGSCWVQSPVQSGFDQYTARCDAAPVFRVWNEPVVHVGDCEIIPVADYDITTTADGSVFSPSLAIGTIPVPSLNAKLWGDLVGGNNGVEWTPPNQFTNVQDVLAILAFIGAAPIQPQFTAANLQAISSVDSCLNAFINTSDVLIAVRAVAGDSYGPPTTSKLLDPTLCPVCP